MTPPLRCKLTRYHYPVINVMAPTSELCPAIQAAAYDSTAVIPSLEQLQSAIDGKLLTIWNTATIPHSTTIRRSQSITGNHRSCRTLIGESKIDHLLPRSTWQFRELTWFPVK